MFGLGCRFCLARAMSQATSDGRSSSGRYSDSGTPEQLRPVNFLGLFDVAGLQSFASGRKSACACCLGLGLATTADWRRDRSALCGGIKPGALARSAA